MIKVTVQPRGQVIMAAPGQKLSEVLKASEVELNTVCGGRGTCGKCRVELLAGKLVGEPLSDGSYLACGTTLGVEDVEINLPTSADAAQRKSNLYNNARLTVKSAINKVFVNVDKPNMADQTPDWERLQRYLPLGEGYTPRLHVLQQLPELLRGANYQVTVVLRGQTVIAVEAGDTTAWAYGIAFDVGTTSVVASLLDLQSGNVLGTQSIANPQRSEGADVISRIEYVTDNPEGSAYLQQKIVSAMNVLIAKLLELYQVDRQYVYEATAVGNTTMQHLLLGIKPTYLARSPYIPTLKSPVELPSHELGLNLAKGATVLVLPNIAGFVGSDTVAVILATDMLNDQDVRLAIDIGTNGEIALGNKYGVVVCSTAAGPAFEGARIRCGMRAAVGAIEAVEINGDAVNCKVIGDTTEVVGICGSGLIQAVAQMLQAGIIEPGGRMLFPEEAKAQLAPNLAERVQLLEDELIFVLADGVYLTQKDIRELQLAKGAIAAGIQVLMKEKGVHLSDIKEILLAGAFGSYIDKESARIIGLVPELPLERIKSIGNAAGTGARMVLLSAEARQEATRVASEARNIELSSRMDFQEAFMETLSFS